MAELMEDDIVSSIISERPATSECHPEKRNGWEDIDDISTYPSTQEDTNIINVTLFVLVQTRMAIAVTIIGKSETEIKQEMITLVVARMPALCGLTKPIRKSRTI